MAIYKLRAEAEGRSPKTISWTENSLRYFRDFLGRDPDVGSITGDDLRRYILALKARPKFLSHPTAHPRNGPVAPATLNCYARAVRAFWTWLRDEELVEDNVMAGVKVTKVPYKPVKVLSEDELRLLLGKPDRKTAVGYRDYTIMLCLFDTLVRASELCNLKLADVDFKSGQFTVMGKGAKGRTVPFGTQVSKAMTAYLYRHRPKSERPEFFVRRDGGPINVRRLEETLKRYGMVAGLRVYPHLFRHSGAIASLRNEADSLHIQRQLGHVTLSTTLIYCRVADMDVKQAHRKYSPVDRLRLI